ncbi:MAG: prepilin-type N-terminal cleavage/methylation domain-containing protein [Deltaproteobacteria bacterium]|nr:prepilin-type N-terminal cleavage/methylation domain-containing protein [Deltaproteobacteria bacterium]
MRVRGRGRSGFTLIEVVVVLAIVALLAAILTPLLLKYLDDSKIGRAKNEVLVLSGAILSFNKDTGLWPVYNAGNPSGTPATSAGTIKTLFTSDGSHATLSTSPTTIESTWTDETTANNFDNVENHLAVNTPKGSTTNTYRTTGPFAWKGPYQVGITADPWGTKYYANVQYFQPGAANNIVWVLSAGPNRQIETSFTQSANTNSGSPGGDDLAFRLK